MAERAFGGGQAEVRPRGEVYGPIGLLLHLSRLIYIFTADNYIVAILLAIFHPIAVWLFYDIDNFALVAFSFHPLLSGQNFAQLLQSRAPHIPQTRAVVKKSPPCNFCRPQIACNNFLSVILLLFCPPLETDSTWKHCRRSSSLTLLRDVALIIFDGL